jgi:hypothetical protein
VARKVRICQQLHRRDVSPEVGASEFDSFNRRVSRLARGAQILGPLRPSAHALILRDTELHRKPDGKWARFYAYGDGRIVEATSEDGNFDAWEKQPANPPFVSQ